MMRPAGVAELWTLTHAENSVRCVAALHPMGIELRYLMNEHPLISRVFDTWDALMGQARQWREGLESRGWTDGRRHRSKVA